jgi:hypothetical protein
MRKGTWKARERKIAADFGAKRTPLSGGNSGHTRSDSLHDTLFIEAKGRQSHAAVKLYDETKELARLEGKTPVVALWQPSRRGYLLVIDPRDVQLVAQELEAGSVGESFEAGVDDAPFKREGPEGSAGGRAGSLADSGPDFLEGVTDDK